MSAPRGSVFRYREYAVDAERGVLTCRYELDGREFTERVTLPPGEQWHTEQARAAARLVFLLSGVSYYKTAAPPVIDFGTTALTQAEEAFLREFYLQGLAEFAYRNNLDLSLAWASQARTGPGPARPPRQRRPRAAPGARAVRRRDRLDRDGGAGPAAGRRGAVRGEQARRPVRRDRAARRGDRATGRPGRTRDRPAAAALGRTRLPQRARAGDRDPVRDRRAGRGAHRPGRGGDVQRVVGVHPDPGVRWPPGQPPVLQERGVRGRLPRRAGGSGFRRSAAAGVLLLAQGPDRAVGGARVRGAHPVPRLLPQL